MSDQFEKFKDCSHLYGSSSCDLCHSTPLSQTHNNDIFSLLLSWIVPQIASQVFLAVFECVFQCTANVSNQGVSEMENSLAFCFYNSKQKLCFLPFLHLDTTLVTILRPGNNGQHQYAQERSLGITFCHIFCQWNVQI